MSNKKNSGLEEDENLEEGEDEGPEDLDEILIKTQENFRTGNESASKYESSPEEILREYREFN